MSAGDAVGPGAVARGPGAPPAGPDPRRPCFLPLRQGGEAIVTALVDSGELNGPSAGSSPVPGLVAGIDSDPVRSADLRQVGGTTTDGGAFRQSRPLRRALRHGHKGHPDGRASRATPAGRPSWPARSEQVPIRPTPPSPAVRGDPSTECAHR